MKKKKRVPKPVVLNAFVRAMERVQVKPPEDRAALMALARQSFAMFKTAHEPHVQWARLADVFNISEQLSEMGICSDAESKEKIARAFSTLGAAHHRFEHLGTWSLKHFEMEAIEEAIFILKVQLDFVSVGEFERAQEIVRERCKQALKGNVGRGVQIVTDPTRIR